MGPQKDVILSHVNCDGLNIIDQLNPLGTGDAVIQSRDYLSLFLDESVLILPGDAPMISVSTLRALVDKHKLFDADCSVLTARVNNPFGFGRIILESDDDICSIIEQKDCVEDQTSINLVNGGIYVFKINSLISLLDMLGCDNSQHEYYLTDMIKIFKDRGLKVVMHEIENCNEISNVNTVDELDRINSL
jgi:bifunctional N-acetylglucosamine-1-phosphate-uridyltransferase/glucosamine-1-phosphate-acetyltransferase GlmU-like protein